MPKNSQCHRSSGFTPSSTNLFIRYLPREVDDNSLREIFSAFGTITSSMVMRDIYSGQSLGTAFVRYEEHEEALRAMRDAHGMPLFGKTVSVQWAKQQHDNTPAGQERLKMNKLFLRNVPLEVTEEDLANLVGPYGSVKKVTMHNDTAPLIDATERRRIVFITFAEQGAAEAALLAVHNTCAFHQCRGIPLMGKLSEDYKQKMRTPRTVRVPFSSRYESSERSRSRPCSKTVSACAEDATPPFPGHCASDSDAADSVGIGTPCLMEPTRRADTAWTSRANDTQRTLIVSETRDSAYTQGTAVQELDCSAAPRCTCETFVRPRTIGALDSGITVTIRYRPSSRTFKVHS
ncbi:RNA recognition motif, putative [Leishmania tarentolae]|uniref:RNA recognition motif, putative n=1 Tax=Leishmania tarentolae TaxID=5689 RepID=A0A640KIZ9_LEITA|nr:RNA recognition motif, putative [Leishmania tarentolae]